MNQISDAKVRGLGVNSRGINRFLRLFVATGWGICDKGAEGALILSERE